MEPLTLAGLCAAAFAAGVIDAVAGGGGLLQVPAAFLAFPAGTLPATVIGTCKVSSFTGMMTAASRYARSHALDWRLIFPYALVGFAGGLLGAFLLTKARPEWMRPLMLVILIVVALYTFLRRDVGGGYEEKVSGPPSRTRRIALGAAIGLVGIYTGFFGPGAGSVLLFLYVRVLRVGFLDASAGVKLVNSAMDLAALVQLAPRGHIVWVVSVPMAVCNVLGSVIGARLAIARGNAFIRRCFMTVVVCVLLRLAWDLFK